MTAEGALLSKDERGSQTSGGPTSWLAQRLRVSTWRVWLVWGVTRIILLAAAIIGQRYCDPQFYHFAGQFAAGQFPYHDYSVEYPPLAVILTLLPALPLLPFAGIAPQPDPAFHAGVTSLPAPDPVRYGAYGVSFAVMMLLVDALTLWLVMRVGRRIASGDASGAVSGLIYTFLTVAVGALLQKFDLAAGMLCLLAIYGLLIRRPYVAWSALAAAALIKGFPILLAPPMAFYQIVQIRAEQPEGWAKRALSAVGRPLGVLVGIIAVVTLAVMLWAGWDAVASTVLYHEARANEIESLWANLELLVGWLPGLAVTTRFNGADLSRVVVSPLDQIVRGGPTILLALLLCVVYAPLVWIALQWRRRVDGESAPANRAQWVIALSLAALLAFMLAFRALPTHYALVLLPLAAVLRLPSRVPRRVWRGAVVALAVLGQGVILFWDALRALEPWAVMLLTARNLSWLAAFGALVVSVYRWPSVRTASLEGTADVNASVSAPPESPDQAETSLQRRGPVGLWQRLREAAPAIPGFSPRDEDVVAHLVRTIPATTLVAVAGAVSLLIYLAFVNAFPITTWWNHPQLAIEMGRVTGYSLFAAVGYIAAILGLFLCQFVALLAARRLSGSAGAELGSRRRTVARITLVALPVLFTLVMIWMQPITTTDLYGYVARGYLYAHLHQNPMITPAQLLPGNILVDRPAAPYGPVWLLIAGAVSLVAGENLLLNMLLFKVFAAVCFFGAILVVDALAKRLYPTRRLVIFVMFAWSPLLLFETIGNGHNDILMMLCVLGAFALTLHGRLRLAFALLVLSALVKYFSLVFVPLWLVFVLYRYAQAQRATALQAGADEEPSSASGRGLVGSMQAVAASLVDFDRRKVAALFASFTVIGAGLVALCYAPFWAGLRTFTGLGQQLRPLYYNGSLVQFIAAPLELFVTQSEYPALDKTVRLVFYLAFFIYAFVQARYLWLRGRDIELRDVITASARVTFAGLILITFWFQPWYVVWLLPLATLATESYIRRQAAILAVGSLLTYAISNYLLVGTPGIGRDLFVQFFAVLVTFAPLLILRSTTTDESLGSAAMRYLRAAREGLLWRPVVWERIMLALILVVAGLLRLLRLGNLFDRLPSSVLNQVSAELRLSQSDTRGLHAPFVFLQNGLVLLFGPTPFATLLPTAILGTLTVLMIYLLAKEIMRQQDVRGAGVVALLAALLAATSQWHVSLSRSGMEVVLLPLLLVTAVYALLRGLRTHLDGVEALKAPGESRLRRVWRDVWPFVLCGLCTGLAIDIAPGLWLLPLLVAVYLVIWRWRRPEWFVGRRQALLALVITTVIVGLPVAWLTLNAVIGFPSGSAVLARSTVSSAQPGFFNAAYWQTVLNNAGHVVGLLVKQDYSTTYPANGGAPIIPAVLTWFFLIGVGVILVRWRSMTATALLILLALPLMATVAFRAPSEVIEAVTVLPAMCIIPALAIYTVGGMLGRLPIALDRINGARVFSTPEQIGRVLLLVFLVISAIRTFFWYFETTLPSVPPNQWIPS
jgi:4-amino-4-deoxy-L-arabinose transferase-like glycosyltransferase